MESQEEKLRRLFGEGDQGYYQRLFYDPGKFTPKQMGTAPVITGASDGTRAVPVFDGKRPALAPVSDGGDIRHDAYAQIAPLAAAIVSDEPLPPGLEAYREAFLRRHGHLLSGRPDKESLNKAVTFMAHRMIPGFTDATRAFTRAGTKPRAVERMMTGRDWTQALPAAATLGDAGFDAAYLLSKNMPSWAGAASAMGYPVTDVLNTTSDAYRRMRDARDMNNPVRVERGALYGNPWIKRKTEGWFGVPEGGDIHDVPLGRQMASTALRTITGAGRPFVEPFAGFGRMAGRLVKGNLPRTGGETAETGVGLLGSGLGSLGNAKLLWGAGTRNPAALALVPWMAVGGAAQEAVAAPLESAVRTSEIYNNARFRDRTLGRRMEARRIGTGRGYETPLSEAAKEPYNSTAARLLKQYPQHAKRPFSEVYRQYVNQASTTASPWLSALESLGSRYSPAGWLGSKAYNRIRKSKTPRFKPPADLKFDD